MYTKRKEKNLKFLDCKMSTIAQLFYARKCKTVFVCKVPTTALRFYGELVPIKLIL